MVDVGGSINGAFNQAHLASQRAEAEKNRTRAGEEQRLRDARKRFLSVQEEVAQTETLRGMRVDPDPRRSDGQDARDQYEAHRELKKRRPPTLKRPSDKSASSDAALPSDPDMGHIIDLEA